MTKRWVYSDPHYFHKNIIKYDDRPFDSVEEMNEYMIKMHNKYIGKRDKVIIAGDFALTNQEQTKLILEQLYGYKILIPGNHDRGRSRTWWLAAGFDEVINFPIIVNDFFIISHEPVYVNQHMPYLNIHGHTHTNELNKDRYINACLNVNDYIPLDLDQLIEKYKKLAEE